VELSLDLLGGLPVMSLDPVDELVGVVDGEGVDVGGIQLSAEVGSSQLVETVISSLDFPDDAGLVEVVPQLLLIVRILVSLTEQLLLNGNQMFLSQLVVIRDKAELLLLHVAVSSKTSLSQGDVNFN